MGEIQECDINTTPTTKLSLSFLPQHYPLWVQDLLGNKKIKVNSVGIFAKMLPTDKSDSVNFYDKADLSSTNIKNDILSLNTSVGYLFTGNLDKIDKPEAITDTKMPWTLYFNNNKMEELWIAVAWGKA